MKRIFSLVLTALFCLTLLTGCGSTVDESSPSPGPESSPEATTPPAVDAAPEATPAPKGIAFSFTREKLPLLDGSTSLVPLAQAAAATLLGESRESVEELTQFNRTTQSYRNLMNGQAELLIASWPAQTVFDEMEAAGFAWEMAPIATDALIFVVNANNPVESLSTEQLIGIYTGEITNWSQVGGRDEPIAAFQRNAGAGSQALMEKLVMKDTPMMEAPTELMAGSMGELMEYVKSYDNSGNALGYSVYYYANDMRMAEGLKIIAVDGVAPTAESIRAGEYPHLSNYYTVIAASAAADSPARILYDWLQSPDGQRLVEQEGYVPVLDTATAASTLTAGGYAVETHELAGSLETPEANYSRLSGEWIDALAAGEDYGALHPFVGTYNYDSYGQKMAVYGLFDASGRIVCDPVYTEVERLSYYQNGAEHSVPLLKLSRGDTHTIASPDGSFVSPESYGYVRVFDFGVLCANAHDSSGFVLYDFEGNVLLTRDDLKLNGGSITGPGAVFAGQAEQLLVWVEKNGATSAWLMDLKGDLLRGGWYSADFLGDGWLEVHTEEANYTGLMDSDGNWVILPIYRHITALGGELFAARDGKGSVIYDRSGQVVIDCGEEDVSVTPFGFRCGEAYYLADGTKLALEGEWNSAFFTTSCPVLYQVNETENTTTLYNVHSGKTLELEGQCLVEQVFSNFVVGIYSDLPYVIVWESASQPTTPKLVGWTLEEIHEFPETAGTDLGAFPILRDGFTGEEYLQVNDGERTPALYSAELELLAERGSYTGVWNGMLVNTDEQFCTYTSFDGDVVFRYPLVLGGGD